MLNIRLINLYSMIFNTISFIKFPASILSKLIVVEVFIKHKNIMLVILGLAIDNHITTNNVTTI